MDRNKVQVHKSPVLMSFNRTTFVTAGRHIVVIKSRYYANISCNLKKPQAGESPKYDVVPARCCFVKSRFSTSYNLVLREEFRTRQLILQPSNILWSSLSVRNLHRYVNQAEAF